MSGTVLPVDVEVQVVSVLEVPEDVLVVDAGLHRLVDEEVHGGFMRSHAAVLHQVHESVRDVLDLGLFLPSFLVAVGLAAHEVRVPARLTHPVVPVLVDWDTCLASVALVLAHAQHVACPKIAVKGLGTVAIFLSMKVYVSWEAKDSAHKADNMVSANDESGVRKIAQTIDHANEIWKSWALSTGGSVLVVSGPSGVVEVPVDHLKGLAPLKEQYEKALGSPTTVGIAMELAQSQQTLRAAKIRPGSIMFYSPEVENTLASESMKKNQPALNQGSGAGIVGPSHPARAAAAVAPSEASGSHSQGEALYGMLQDAAENQPPAPEMTHAAKDLQEQQEAQGLEDDFKNHADGHAQREAGNAQADEVRKKVVSVLQKIREQAPLLEQIQQASPETFQAVMNMAKVLVTLARALVGAPAGQDQGASQNGAQEASQSPSSASQGQSVSKSEPHTLRSYESGRYIHSPKGRDCNCGHKGDDHDNDWPNSCKKRGCQCRKFRMTKSELVLETFLHKVAEQHGHEVALDLAEMIKTSWNVKQQRANITPKQAQQRRVKYAQSIGLQPKKDEFPSGAFPEARGNMLPYGGQFGVEHETAHAMMTPPDKMVGEYQEWLTQNRDPASDDYTDSIEDENVANRMEYQLDRRAGVDPNKFKSRFRDQVSTPSGDDDNYEGEVRTVESEYIAKDPETKERAQDLTTSAKFHVGQFDGGARFDAEGRIQPPTGINARINSTASSNNPLAVLRSRAEALRAKRAQEAVAQAQAKQPGLPGIPLHREKPTPLPKSELDASEPDPSKPVPKGKELDKASLVLTGSKPPKREHLNLPVGTVIDGEGKFKVQHNDGSESWKQGRSGVIMSQDPTGHPTSSREPNAR